VADQRHVVFLRMLEQLNRRHLVGVEDRCELWLIRHADAYDQLTDLGDGLLDPPLSERGREETRLLAARLSGVRLDAVWSSGLRRARETAAAVALGHGLPIRVDEGLREVRTQWDEGRLDRVQRPGVYPFVEPESEVVSRMRSVAARMVAELDALGPAGGPRRTVAVSHNAAISIYVASVLGLSWGQLRLMPQFTSVTVLAARGDRVVVHSIADATHLAGMPGPRAIP
jgi:broad specificity phosphatase PhoE